MVNKTASFVFNRVGVPKFEKYLDLASFRHKLVGGNVANVSTPGYRTRDIDFNAEFARLTKETDNLAGLTTNNAHLPLGFHSERPPEPDEVKVSEGEMNSVDIDKEISNLAQNELVFTVAARLLKQKFDGLRKAITSR
ncbi:MAG: flagellar basal body rod protein FlgB [candidate division Zixibacteria bacterium]|nr:flagellar basal body rod protein FlgB [candidate division Zixibacteria bacterium]MDH3937983.1 flagellar basal body rod protein FlgB [candidate division Zixibacteria bacterium]MDH4033159.1 flagellar basal body rod protein FlgB [candidate division Zixibacteria bacterium]